MKFKNLITGTIVEVDCPIKGPDWEEVKGRGRKPKAESQPEIESNMEDASTDEEPNELDGTDETENDKGKKGK